VCCIDHIQLAMAAGREDEARRFHVGLLELVESPKPAHLAARGGAGSSAERSGRMRRCGMESLQTWSAKRQVMKKTKVFTGLLSGRACGTRRAPAAKPFDDFAIDRPVL
jgi:hypothetical protein